MATTKFYTITAAAEFLGIHPETLRRWDRLNKLKAEKINSRGDRRYSLETLSRFKEVVRLGTDNLEEAKEKINEVLEQLELKAENAKYILEIGDSFRSPRDLAYYVLDDEEKSQNFQTLLDVFNFEIVGDELKAKMSGTDEKGKVWKYPVIENFSKKDTVYLRNLLPTIYHSRLRSRIAHVVWTIEKDPKMAEIAIHEYLKTVGWLSAKLAKEPESPAFEISNSLKSAYVLAKKIKKNVAIVNKSIAYTILNFDNKSASKFAITHQLIKLALENKKEFGHDFWENCVKICKSMADELESNKNLFFSRDFLILGEKIEQSVLGFKDKGWRKKIAVSLEAEAKKHEGNFVQSDFLLKAIHEYKVIGDLKKVEELEKELQDSKKNMNFQTFETSYDLTDWVGKIRASFKKLIASENSEQILTRLTIDKSIIPKYQDVKNLADKMDKEYPLQSLFSHTIIDVAGNMPRKYDTEPEKKYLSFVRQYGLTLKMSDILVQVLFEEILAADRIDINSIEKYISDHLWYGKEYKWPDIEDDKVGFKSKRWIDILKPGIAAYLASMRLLSKKKTKEARDQLILAVDSLTPKIEGIIREFYETIGKNTDRMKVEKGQRYVTEKKSIDELLREPYAEEIFGNDLLSLMKYVLIELSGHNLRNNVSHSLMFKENYMFSYAHWVFIILLRIGAYEIGINKKQTDGVKSL